MLHLVRKRDLVLTRRFNQLARDEDRHRLHRQLDVDARRAARTRAAAIADGM